MLEPTFLDASPARPFALLHPLFPAKHGAWAGTCSDAASLAGVPTLQTITSGNTMAYNVTNFGRVKSVIGTITGKRLYAVHAADSVRARVAR